ncbi:MAG: hypothetical protein K2O28_03480 [Clostridia bacterium]|nr:hypothetical protein [Clostridia bacterium]
MTNENVDILYNKLEKKVAKNKRADLKKALVSSNNEKFEKVNSLNMEALHPFGKPKGFIGWVATFLGWLFIVFNLLAYSFAVPTYQDNGSLAGKVGTDFKNFSSTANDGLTSTVNESILTGIRSAYDNDADGVQLILNKLDNSAYGNTKDVQDKLESLLKQYSEYQDNTKAFQEKYSAKLTAENALNAAKTKYATAKAKYEATLAELKSMLIAFSEDRGAFDGIPEIVYAEEQKKYDAAVASYNALIKDYTEEQKTELDANKAAYANALSEYEDASANYSEALNKKAEDNDSVKSAQATLIIAQQEYDEAIDVGTYDVSSYEQALKDAQTALVITKKEVQDLIDNEIKETKAALDNAEKVLNAAKAAIPDLILKADEAVAIAEKSLNDTKAAYQLLLDELNDAIAENDSEKVLKAKLAIAEIVYEKTAATDKTSLTEKYNELKKDKEAIKPLTDAENSLNLAKEQLDSVQIALTASQNNVLSTVDEIVNLVNGNGGFKSSDLFDKIITNYETTVESYLTLTESKEDAAIVIDRFLEKNLSAFDTTVSALTEFISYGYSLNVLEADLANFDALEYNSLSAKLDTALSEFKVKYALIADAQAAYEQVYGDYKLAWDNYNKALKIYNADSSDENKVALDSEEINLEVEKSSYKFLLIEAVNNIALAKGEANAYLNRLSKYIAVYQRVAVETSSILNGSYVYITELSGNHVKDEKPLYFLDDGKMHLNYLVADTSTVNAVLGDYDLPGYVDNFKNYFASVDTCDEFIKGADFNSYTECSGLTDNDLSSLDGAVSKVNDLFNDFDSITKDLNTDSSSLFTYAKNCTLSSDMIFYIMMVFDIIVAVVLFGYWLLIMLLHRSEAMEKNYNGIIESLKD